MDAKKSKVGLKNRIQYSSHAIGLALKKVGLKNAILAPEAEEKIVKELCEVIKSGRLSGSQLISCILALGCICDQREKSFAVDGQVVQEALDTLEKIEEIYPESVVRGQRKSHGVAVKMLNGSLLDIEDEQFLLTKLEL